LKRAFRIIAGFALIVLGAVLSIPLVPGPGIPIILLGLFLLSDHFEWARRLVAWFRSKVHRLTAKTE
jgi:hypothetical protein